MQGDAEKAILALQEAVAHLTAQLEDMSAIMAGQSTELERLRRRVRALMEREAERIAGETGTHLFADERPPHW